MCWTRFWFPWKPMFTDSESTWPPDDLESNSCTQHLSLHCQMKNKPKLTTENSWGTLTDVDNGLGHTRVDVTENYPWTLEALEMLNLPVSRIILVKINTFSFILVKIYLTSWLHLECPFKNKMSVFLNAGVFLRTVL